jgi:nitroreductase
MVDLSVTKAVSRRFSARAFLSTPVPSELIREILRLATRSPSGGNLQPWEVYGLAGAELTALKAAVATLPEPEQPAYEVYPANLWDPYRTRRFKCGEALYASIRIERGEKEHRLEQLRKNQEFFGAPAALFFCLDRNLGAPQWADMGMFMQTVMLLAAERGLDTCAQEYWASYATTVANLLQLPQEQMVFAGMAVGYADFDHPINNFRTEREPLEAFAHLRGFE